MNKIVTLIHIFYVSTLGTFFVNTLRTRYKYASQICRCSWNEKKFEWRQEWKKKKIHRLSREWCAPTARFHSQRIRFFFVLLLNYLSLII